MNRETQMKTHIEAILARSAVYRLLSVGFAHPAPEILALFRDGFARKLAEAVSRLSGDDLTELAAAVEGLYGAATDLDGRARRIDGTARARGFGAHSFSPCASSTISRISKIEITGSSRMNRNMQVTKKPMVPSQVSQSQIVG